MFEKLINAFFPLTCPICGKIISGNQDICTQCERKIHIVGEPKCQKCGKPMRNDTIIYCADCRKRERSFDRGVVLFEHKGEIRDSIYKFKYDNKRQYASYYGRVAAERYGSQFRKWKIDTIIPVPIHKRRKIKRGYNQAFVFASEIADRTGIILKNNIIIRKKNTLPQKELNSEMRYLNLKNAFAVSYDRMRGIENVLLVDDIFTTGNTVEACARILKKAGVKHVYVICISAGISEE